jgi:hypothetical protein
MKKTLVIILMLCATYNVFAQSYKIDVTIKGLQDSTLLLAVHGGATKYAVDTVVLDKNGKGTFEKTNVEGGMYFLVLNGMALFDFLVSADGSDNFGIVADKDDYSKLKFVNSLENTAMLAYIDFRNQQQKKYENLMERLSTNNNDADEQNALRAELLSFNRPLIEFSDSLANKFKGKFLATVVSALKPLEEPDFNLPEDDPDRDRKIAINYYLFNKEHFFDNIDFFNHN